MSLNYDLSSCVNLAHMDESLTEEERDLAWQWTQALIFRCMAVDLGEITVSNVDEFWFRCQLNDRIFGRPQSISYELVRKHIGLKTNVTNRTRNQFVKRSLEMMERDIMWESREERMAHLQGA